MEQSIWPWCLSLIGVLGCADVPALARGTVRVEVMALERGAVDGGVLVCERDGLGCRPAAAGETLEGEKVVRTTRGGRVVLGLGQGSELDLSGEASVSILAKGRAVRVDRGLVTVANAKDLAVQVLDHTVRASEEPATFNLLASAADRVSLTVRRGHVVVSRPGSQLALAAGDSARLSLGKATDEREAEAAPLPSPPPFEREPRRTASRGLGSMTARVPGTEQVVSGVRLVAHRAVVTVRDGYARTEIEEEFANDTSRVLEGRYVFPVPSGASLSRLALWVGKDLVEGEVVQKERAARIFKGIVDDTVRPRDPALLEWVKGGEFSLKIFPIPAHGRRKLVLAYNEILPSPRGRVRYVYPLSLGEDRSVKIDDFSITVTATDSRSALTEVTTLGYPATLTTEDKKVGVSFAARDFVPERDFELGFQREGAKDVEASAYAPNAGEFGEKGEERRGFVALRLSVEPSRGKARAPRGKLARGIVIDVSASQSKETLAGEGKLALGLLRALDADERFVVLACDSACTSYPEDGLADATEPSLAEARRFVEALAPRGSSDVAGSLVEGARRLEAAESPQLVVLGDGAPTSGELGTTSIAERARPWLERAEADVRFLGAGRTLDAVVLGGLARSLGATYEPAFGAESIAQRVDDLAVTLRRAVVVDAELDVSGGLEDVFPKTLPNLRVGQELVLVGRLREGASEPVVKLKGTLGGEAYLTEQRVRVGKAVDAFQNPLVPRLWAEARIGDLETAPSAEATEEVVRLSKNFHVVSRHTSLLVLENDRMFAEFGIERTQKHAGDQSDHAFGFLNGNPLVSAPESTAAAPPSKDAGEPASARGNLSGADAFGSGGLGLAGIGEGGGGKGPGIGLGSLGTIGHGAGTGKGNSGFGSGNGRLAGEHKSRVPRIRMGSTVVTGRLPPEVVQRIVRQNSGRFRFCYENGLRKNPALAGRVTVRFVIGRDGAVAASSDAGSDLPDKEVVACVAQAVRHLAFPQPEGGIVTVTYPIVFSSDGTRPIGPQQPWPTPKPEPLVEVFSPPKPLAAHRAADEAWRSEGAAAVQKAREDAGKNPTSRGRRVAFVRTLLARGRFDEALAIAERFAEEDPDASGVRALLADARAASGDGPGALFAVDAEVEMNPASALPHLRAARAFEAGGDDVRACAHWRSLAEIKPEVDAYRVNAWRCRARVLDDRAGVLAEANRVSKPGKAFATLIAALEQGELPAFEDAAAKGRFEAELRCAPGHERCGAIVVVTPEGAVVSPWTPTAARGVALAALSDGTYRTLLVGGPSGALGEVELRALGAVKRFKFERGGTQTLAATLIANANL